MFEFMVGVKGYPKLVDVVVGIVTFFIKRI